MTTNQIFGLVNAVVAEGVGSVPAQTVVDTQSLVSLGNEILSSNSNTECFLNTLVQRIGRTVISFREYRNKLSDMVINDFEYGAILQKIAVKMPVAKSDPSYELVDGESVDMFTVSKPEVLQKFFVTRTPYMFEITIAREQLKEAFTSAENMGGFIGAIFGEVRNAIEFSLEELGRATIANYIGEVKDTDREIKLVTDFNAEMGLTGTDALTPETALHSDLFLNYAIGRINHHAKMMTEMSVRYNDGSKPRFTPVDRRVIRLLSDFDTRAQTVTQYAAYHDNYVSVGGTWDSMSYWQNFARGNEANVKVKRASDGADTEVSNVIAVMYDKDALGIYKKDEEVLTSPLNSKGRYYNTHYHEKQLWFNDLTENFISFVLA